MELRLIIMALVCLCIAQVAFAAEETYPFTEPQEQQRFVNLTKEIRCAACQNQTLFDSNAALALDMRANIYHMLQTGLSDQQIRDHLSYRYGEYILFNPPLRSNTWILWLFPIFLMALALRSYVRLIQMPRYS